MKWFSSQKSIEQYLRRRIKYLSNKLKVDNVKIIKSKLDGGGGACCYPHIRTIYIDPKILSIGQQKNEAILTAIALHELGHIMYIRYTREEQEYTAEKYCIKIMKKLYPKLYKIYLPYRQYQINCKILPVLYLKAFRRIKEYK
jgi:hypothetical protein